MAAVENMEMPEDVEESATGAEEQEQDGDSVSGMDGAEFNCSLCDERYKLPKVLSCLHIFCMDCIKKLLETSDDGKDEDAVPKSKASVTITCPTCKQVTEANSVESLPTDHVTVNMLEVLAIKDKTVVCTSCKSQQPAVARCSDCANFLCPICVSAHQSMRCFENHKVIQFGDMKEEGNVTPVIHKPLFCPVHSTENMKYFCSTCQVPICNECMVSEHQQPTHFYSRMAAVEAAQIAEISELVKKCRGQMDECDEASQTLQGFLSELQMQRDNARGLIEETYQSYRAMMEKIKVQLLEKLEEMHSQQELKVMEMLHSVEKTAQRVEDGCAFGERLLKNGSPVEVLLLKRVVATQLQSLLGDVPRIADVGKIEFVTDDKLFRSTIAATFGRLNAVEPAGQQRTSVSAYSQVPQQHTVSSSPSSHSHGAESSPTFSHEVAAAFGRDLQSPGSGLHHHQQQQQSSIVTASDILANLPPLSLASLVNQSGVFGSLPELMSGLEGLGSTHPSVSSSNAHTSLDLASLGGGERSQSREGGLHSPSNILDPMPVGSGTAIVGRAATALGAFTDLQAALGNTSGLGLSHSTNGHHGGGLDLASLAQSLNSQMTPSMGMPPMSSEASLASLLNTLSSNHTSNLNLNDLSNLLNSGSQSSTMSAMMEASNLLAQSAHSLTDNSSIGRSISPGVGGNGFNQSTPMSVPFPARNAKKVHAMQIRCKFGQQGQGYGQFNSPHGFCLGMDDDIVVADTMNHRIEIFDKNGEHKYQFGIAGKEEGQLWYPRKVAVQRQTGKYIVCDRGNERSRMQIFLKNGHFVKKIAIRYIDIVAGIAISAQGHIVAVDSVTPTVFCISEAGDLIRWFDCSDYMREPSDIAICGKEYFVCDFKGHCVVVFSEAGQFMRRIGSETITTFPNGIDVSDAGDILVGDSHGNRFHVAVFQRSGTLVGEFECPYIKVSRCCGLKISSEGYIVTLAKNNHYVIVLNTLYIA